MGPTRDLRPSQGTKYRIFLLVVALAVIGAGILLRPREKQRENQVSSIDGATLRRLTQERRLEELGDYIAYAAQNAARGLVYIPELQQSAVAVGPHTLATSPRRGAPATVTGKPRGKPPVLLQFRSRRPDVPVLQLEAPPNVFLPVAPDASVDTGDWVIAVALRDDGYPVFAYGLYENSTDARCGYFTYKRIRAGIPLTAAFQGGGLYSLRGELAGIIARCDSEFVVLSVASISAALQQPAAPDEILQDSFGFRVATAAAGVEVVSVWKSTPADKIHLTAGDLILSIDSERVTTPEDTANRLSAEGRHTLAIRRGRTEISLVLGSKPATEPVPVTSFGFVLFDTPDGIVMRSITKNGPADRAGVLPGDVLHTIAGAPVDSATLAADRLAQTRGPVHLTLDRSGQEFEVQVTP